MRTLLLIIVVFFSWSSFASFWNADKNGLMLEGYDPVSYQSPQGPKMGSEKFQAVHEGGKYLFSTVENLQIFKSNPKKYAPAFGGWCAYGVAESRSKVSVDPRSFVIQDGRLLLFYDSVFADTRSRWLSNKKKTPEQYLKEADTLWTEVKNQNP